MGTRALYLAAYDVADPRRLAGALRLARAYATGGQKSVHEIFLSPAEHRRFVAEMGATLNLEVDRFLLLRLDPRARMFTLGRATPAADPDHFYVG